MTEQNIKHVATALAFVVLFLLGEGSVSWGQKPPPPVPPNPQAPVLAVPVPSGAQRGTTTDLLLTGTNLAGPTGAWLGCPAKVTIPTEDKNGQDNAKLKIKLDIPADAPIGLHAFRLATTRGISNVRLFAVDDLPQVIEGETNRKLEAAQAVPVPSVVSGKADAEASDFFKITVAAGQRLSFDMLGRRLGGAIDAQLSLYSAKTKRELAYDNDSPGCQGDPRLSYTFKEAGDYVVEVKDVLNRGGADYAYRLRIGDFPLATVPIPMAAKRGSKVKVEFAGPHVEGVAPVDVAAPNEPGVNVVWVAPKGPGGLHGWPVALALSDIDEGVEQEPNHEPGKAKRLTVPGGVTGRFQQSDDTDGYVFSAKKGQKLAIEAQTLEMHSPTLVYMVVKNAKNGAEVAKSNPAAPTPADQRIDFTAPDDGDFLVEVQHLNYMGGPSEAYHLTIKPSTPGFDVTLGIERYDLAAGAMVPLNVLVGRRGYTGPIDLSVIGHPGLTGTAKIKAGANNAALVVRAQPEVPMGPYVVHVRAKATIDGKEVVEDVTVRGPLSTSLGGLLYPPMQVLNQVALAVREKAPFKLAVKMEPMDAVPGVPAQVTIIVQRDAGFAEEVTINPPIGLPPNVPAPKLAAIAKDKSELKFNLDINAKATPGDYQILFSGKAKTKDKEFSTSAPPLDVSVGPPFELKVEPAILDLKPGAKAKLKVNATRRGGYKGPIALEVRKLPANVTGGKAAIAQDQNSVEIDIAAAATAAPGDKTDVDVNGTATALNNQQNASPAFTVRIPKK